MVKNLILAPKIFLQVLPLLGIVTSYHCMQFQGKLMIPTQENDKKPHFRADTGLLGPNLGH